MAQNKEIIKPTAATTATPVVKEELNEASLRRLLGEFSGQVCVYNCETQSLLSDTYNGVEVWWNGKDTQNAAKTKQYFEGAFPDFEVVAYINGQTTVEYFPGWNEWTEGKVKFDKNGEYTIGNIILRNKKTKNLEMFRPNWFGVREHWAPGDAARSGASGLPYRAVEDADFRKHLLAGENDKAEGAPVAITATPIKGELSEVSLRRVLGEFYGQVCVYDCKSQRLLTKTYNGVKVYWGSDDTWNAARTKQYIEEAFPDFEVVALVSGQTTQEYVWGYGKWAKKKVKFKKNGGCIISNAILKNKVTGELELFNPSVWFCVGCPKHPDAGGAARLGAGELPHGMIYNIWNFRAKFLAGRSR